MDGFAGFIQDVRPEPGEGATMEQVLGRAQRRSWYDDAGPEPDRDPDELAAALLARGYAPGMVSQLSQRLADVTADLQSERDKIERGEVRAGNVSRDLAAGRIGAMEASARLDGDFGDAARADQLERRAASLRLQLQDAAGAIAPAAAQRADPVEAASRRAHDTFVAVTRAKMEAIQAGRPAPARARRPFASRGADAVRSELECYYCASAGLDHETSTELHLDPEFDVPITTQEQAVLAAGQSRPALEAEVDRLQALGYSAESARLAAQPVRVDGQDYLYDKRHDEIARVVTYP